jgi:hypothetical protein
MSICIACAAELPSADALCPHHHTGAPGEEWARWNRIVCDLIHRGIEPPPGDPTADAVPIREEVTAPCVAALAPCLEGAA